MDLMGIWWDFMGDKNSNSGCCFFFFYGMSAKWLLKQIGWWWGSGLGGTQSLDISTPRRCNRWFKCYPIQDASGSPQKQSTGLIDDWKTQLSPQRPGALRFSVGHSFNCIMIDPYQTFYRYFQCGLQEFWFRSCQRDLKVCASLSLLGVIPFT